MRAFFHSERSNAQCLHRRYESRDCRPGGLDANVVRSRRPTANTNAMTVPHPAVVSSAARNGHIQVGACQLLHWGATVLGQPAIDDFEDTRLQYAGFKYATVEENR